MNIPVKFMILKDELLGIHLYDTNSGNKVRGICSLPFVRQSDGETRLFPIESD